MFLFQTYYYFKSAYSHTFWVVPSCHLFRRQHLEWSSFLRVQCFFKTSFCSHAFFQRYLVNSPHQLHPFTLWKTIILLLKKAVAVMRSFKFIMFFQKGNCSKEISWLPTLLPAVVSPWPQIFIYWKISLLFDDIIYSHPFFLW